MMKQIVLFITVLSLVSCTQKKISTTEVVERPYLIDLLNNSTSEKVQVINFWATWCAPCVEELPAFVELDNDEEVNVVLISLDDVINKDSLVDPFLKKHKITAKVVLLNDPYAAEWVPMVDQHWDGAIPATLIKKGSKKMFYNKAFTASELREEIKKFL